MVVSILKFFYPITTRFNFRPKTIGLLILAFLLFFPVTTRAEIQDPETLSLIREYQEVSDRTAQIQKFLGENATYSLDISSYQNRPPSNPVTKEELTQLKNALRTEVQSQKSRLYEYRDELIDKNPSIKNYINNLSGGDIIGPKTENTLDAAIDQWALDGIRAQISYQERTPTASEQQEIEKLTSQIEKYKQSPIPSGASGGSTGDPNIPTVGGGGAGGNNSPSPQSSTPPKPDPVSGRKIDEKCTFRKDNMFYCMLAPIGIFTDDKQFGRVQIGPEGFTKFLNNLVRFAISIATGLAVVMIVIGGVQYSSTDAISGKSDGAARIKQALSGLILALVSYVILNTINPDVFATDLGLKTPEASDIFTLAEIQEIEANDAAHEHEHDQPITNPLGEFKPTAASEAAFPGIGEYKGNVYTAKDNSGNTGNIAAQVAYLRDYVPTRWKYLLPISTYRSHAHNKKVGGSPTSDHLRGAAIDFAARNKNINSLEFINDGYSLMEFLKQNGSAIGVDQIIFREQNWRLQNDVWVRGGEVGGHMDHIHVGFQ